MEDFDVFTDEIEFTKPLYRNILNKFLNEVPDTPNSLNYQSARKLIAEECLAAGKHVECAFHLSESVSATIRTMAIYRDEQTKINDQKINKIKRFIKPVKDLVDPNAISEDQDKLFNFLTEGENGITERLEKYTIEEEPFYMQYLRFGSHNNVDNFIQILKELPKEWTVIQLTAPYNPSENTKPREEHRTEINSLYLSMFTNDYLDDSSLGPFTIHIPANVTKEGEVALFPELYSLLEENYRTIDNAHLLNNKRLVQNYWSRREDVDLRLKSVINVMDKEWLSGWGCLLTGKLEDGKWKTKVTTLVDATITDWGFIKLSEKQRILLYNLIEACPVLNSSQIKTCIRRILTEHGNTEELRKVLENPCENCTRDFTYPSELCLKCLSKCFESLHHFTLVDGIKAFSQAARILREDDEWSGLKKALRHPVVLIVDECLDTFPWETLPILNQHPVTRIENIHMLYYLFKIHERSIMDGYFIAKPDVGRYVINPEKNLDRMEKRMSSFVKYWCGGWRGHIGQAPTPEEFLQYLTEADIFLYCGHGDGCRLGAGGAGVEAARGHSLIVLSGCGSARLQPPAGRAPPHAAHLLLHVAASPMVVGMLWEVTDLEVDKVVSSLVALCTPSAAPRPWPRVGKARWSQGQLDTKADKKAEESEWKGEPNVLRALCGARASSAYVMIASSVVARGLPACVIPTITE